MHEHVFVLSPEIIDNHPDVWGDEAQARGRRDQPPQRAQVPRRGQHRRPDGDRARPLHPPHRADRRGHRHQHRRRHRPLHLQRRAAALLPARPGDAARRPGDHDRHVRRRHHRRHRRHRHQGGNPQVRHRRTGCHPWRRAGAAGGRAGAPPDRRADLDAHPRRHPAGAGAAADLRRRGRRPVPRRDRALRRHHRHRLSGRADRQRLLHRHGPLRARHLPDRPRNG